MFHGMKNMKPTKDLENLKTPEEQPLRSDNEFQTNGVDYGNIILLLVLYFLQGIPLGIGGVIPMMLVNRGVSYSDQALFSLALYPFSLKLLWAPFVDSYYWKAFGRRKSWVVPVQYGIASFMVLLSFSVDHLIGKNGEGSPPPDVTLLTICFLFLVFLTATQDIAVDGWAVSILSEDNKEYAASCNAVGGMLGGFTGSTLFLALESPTFSNTFLRSTPQEEGLVTLKGYLLFWAIVYIVVTTLVMILKHEKDYHEEAGTTELGFVKTCKMLWGLLQLPSLRCLVVVLLTHSIGTAADAATELKMIEFGVKRESFGMIRLVLFPFHMVMPWIISKLALKNPLKAYLYAYPFKLFFTLVSAALVWWTSTFEPCDGFPFYFYAVLTVESVVSMIPAWIGGLSLWCFLVTISDPLIGGTYMTLLNTLNNLGGSWTRTSALYFLKFLNFEWCPNNGYICKPSVKSAFMNQTCHSNGYGMVNSTVSSFSNSSDDISSNLADQSSNFMIDGYFVEKFLCLILGLIWISIFARKLLWLEKAPKSMWRCRTEDEHPKSNNEISL